VWTRDLVRGFVLGLIVGAGLVLAGQHLARDVTDDVRALVPAERRPTTRPAANPDAPPLRLPWRPRRYDDGVQVPPGAWVHPPSKSDAS